MKHWVLLFSFVLLLSGCERKKRAPSVDPTSHPESEQKNKAETGQLGWLRLLAESPKKLETLISSSTLWSMFLQNQHQKLLLDYDRIGEIKPMDSFSVLVHPLSWVKPLVSSRLCLYRLQAGP